MSDIDETPETPEEDVRMSIWEHLDELRKRLVRSAAALMVGAILCWAYRVQVLAWLLRPYERAWAARELAGAPELQTLSAPDALMGYMQLALVGGLVFAIPVVFYQLWAFISPGLYAKEKRFIYPFVFFSTLLFLSGIAFAYYVAFPFMYDSFFAQLGQISSAGTMLTQRPTLEYYLDFTTRMLLVFGFVFELPLLVTFLALARIVTPQALLKFGKFAIVGSCVIGAIATPGQDIGSMLALSGALTALYFIAVGVSFVVVRPRKDGY